MLDEKPWKYLRFIFSHEIGYPRNDTTVSLSAVITQTNDSVERPTHPPSSRSFPNE